ncbi:nucleotidyltransferase family protein [Cytobacillus sp. S13-E01]|uniref:nucleotidyltransferase family protein n=1 Tax=Cytobacillus sp. S13-E01 TaxID=3031326 RepID=UPI0023D867DA|nr:nucleotidyltransferase family protein [Cytobacillus sp. S13-E01]MDF0727749.1 nucleotidyltransferase family protein [Cytobacillus sp. S13-E01]
MAIELIRALYDSNTPIPDKDEYYNEAIEDIEFFDISSQIYHLLKQAGKLEETPLFFQKRLKQKYTEALYQNLFIKNQTEMLLKEFERSGIEVIPIKGTVFAEQYFGHIGARSTSDIDLLIKNNELDRAIECINTLGFTPDLKDIPSGFNLTFNKELPQSTIPLMVELHWNIVDPTTADLNIEEFWNQSKPFQDFNYVKELSDFHTFYMIVLHGWRHNMNSLKYFIDILQLIHNCQGRLDLITLFKVAKDDKTLKRLIRTLTTVYTQFSYLEQLIKLPSKKRYIFWNYEHIRNTDNRSIKKYFDFFDYQIFSYDSIRFSIKELCIWFLPPTELINVEKEMNNRNIAFLYIRLFKKRISNFLKTIRHT